MLSAKKSFPLSWLAVRWLYFLSFAALCPAAVPAQQAVHLRYLDSETGYRVQPDRVALAGEQAAEIDVTDQASLRLENGIHLLRVSSRAHHPMVAGLAVQGADLGAVRIWLDPLQPPFELRPEYIRTLHRPDAMVITGVIVDDDSSEPLEGVRVSSELEPTESGEPLSPGIQTETNARGLFELRVPIPDSVQSAERSATLIFARPGYRTQENEHVEVWRSGDWTYRVRLAPDASDARTVIDERQLRRRTVGTSTPGPKASVAETTMSELSVLPPSEGLRQFDPATAANAGATVRVPRNIRVLGTDGVAIDYVSLESYCRHVLPAEWIASWAAYPGGNHALNAGAVTVRTYAVGAINKPKTSTYDICGTTACQVYGPATSTDTDAAVSETTDFVMVADGGTIPAALTEYSAENNSIGFDCGDAFTAPSSGCDYDPVCAGETRNGHGRGLCQWGSAKWATGLKFPGNSTRDHVSLNGFPPRDWTWILEHYYPALQLVKGAPLILGDEVTARTTLNVRACPGGGIDNGINCPTLAAESAGATGHIMGGPIQITSDGASYTWYQVRWADVTGWSVENYLERTVLPPHSPTGLTASGASTGRIDLAWTDTSDVETGFIIERAPGMAGPWSEIAVAGANVSNYSDTNLFPSSSWFYRVRAFNAAGDSVVSNSIGATTLGESPVLLPIRDQIVMEGTALLVPARATAPDFVHVIADFENYPSLNDNGEVLFREPRFSSTTRTFLADTPDLAVLSDVFPPGPNTGRQALQISCAFVQATGPWLRLTTAGAPAIPNPVIDLTAGLRLDVWADKPVGVALGVRETSTAAGAALGSDGGTNGPVQWVGVTGVLSGQPQPTRSVPANTWTTCAFSFQTEPVRSLAGDESRLDSSSGFGVWEHLVLVPLAGPGIYNLYLDNVAVITPKTLAYSLAPGTPVGAIIDSTSGTIMWTPGPQDAGQTYSITVRATDNAQPSLTASRTFQVTVLTRPSLQVTLSGSQVILSWLATKDVNYRVQIKGSLADPVWSDLTTNFTAAGAVASFTDKLGATQRFYRVLIVN